MHKCLHFNCPSGQHETHVLGIGDFKIELIFVNREMAMVVNRPLLNKTIF